MSFISGERHTLCCWRRLEGRGETDPPETAVCELQCPVGGRRLRPQPSAQQSVEEASVNLPQVTYPLGQGWPRSVEGTREP